MDNVNGSEGLLAEKQMYKLEKKNKNNRILLFFIVLLLLLNIGLVIYIQVYAKPNNKFPFDYKRNYDPSKEGT